MASNHLEDKQTIVTNLALTTAIDLKMFLQGKLPKWTEHRKHAKILIICGAHGDTDGSIAEEAEPNSLQNLKVNSMKYFIWAEQCLKLYIQFDFQGKFQSDDF